MISRRLLVTGRVQGVFYRASAKEKADELGVTGWVRNLDDGSVEIHAEGTKDQLKELEDWCWKGPPASVVTAVKRSDAHEEHCTGFDIRR